MSTELTCQQLARFARSQLSYGYAVFRPRGPVSLRAPARFAGGPLSPLWTGCPDLLLRSPHSLHSWLLRACRPSSRSARVERTGAVPRPRPLPPRTPARLSLRSRRPGPRSPLFGPVTERGAPLNTLASLGICKMPRASGALRRKGPRGHEPLEPQLLAELILHGCSVDELGKPVPFFLPLPPRAAHGQ